MYVLGIAGSPRKNGNSTAKAITAAICFGLCLYTPPIKIGLYYTKPFPIMQ